MRNRTSRPGALPPPARSDDALAINLAVIHNSFEAGARAALSGFASALETPVARVFEHLELLLANRSARLPAPANPSALLQDLAALQALSEEHDQLVEQQAALLAEREELKAEVHLLREAFKKLEAQPPQPIREEVADEIDLSPIVGQVARAREILRAVAEGVDPRGGRFAGGTWNRDRTIIRVPTNRARTYWLLFRRTSSSPNELGKLRPVMACTARQLDRLQRSEVPV